MTTGSDIYPPAEQVQVPPPKRTRNTVGLIALITAIVGAVFAVIPGALVVGWILLPIAFILSIVSLFLKNQKRGQGIAALIISVVGTIIGFIVFFAVVTTAVDEAFNEDVEIQSPGDGGEVEESVVDGEDVADEGDAEASGEEGSRDSPLALGTSISESDWEVTVNSVDLNATDAVLAENPLNEDPADGHGYVLANVTATYVGNEAAGDSPGGTRLEYVTADGNSFDSTANMIIAPDYFNRSETLYEGASTTGNFVVEVPMDDVENGNVLLSPSMFGDGVFFEVQ